MLSASAAETVRATLPAVGKAIDEVARVFYRTMFTDHPKLLDGLFNRGNQATGEQRAALAGSVVTFARVLVERPGERPDALLGRIAHKHVSVGVRKDQYPLVQHYLFQALRQVLGPAVTPAVAEAWAEVYWLMAHSLIAVEERLYARSGADRYGQWRPWRVEQRVTETPGTVSFWLAPADETPVPGFRPGQYVSVAVDLPDGTRQLRQYSLSGASPEGRRRITVRRVTGDAATPAGEVSELLHREVRAGDILQLSAPAGDIALDEGGAPVLLASAGIGITPMAGMLAHLAAARSRRRVIAVHADRSETDHALREEQARLIAGLPEAELHLWYEECAAGGTALPGRCDLSRLELPPGLVAYLCGPVPFLKSAREDLLRAGVAPRDVHYEVFGPDLGLA